MNASEIVYIALVWAEENMEAMIESLDGVSGDDCAVERQKVATQLRQLREYRKRRFGSRIDPIASLPKIDARTRQPISS